MKLKSSLQEKNNLILSAVKLQSLLASAIEYFHLELHFLINSGCLDLVAPFQLRTLKMLQPTFCKKQLVLDSFSVYFKIFANCQKSEIKIIHF